MESGQWHTFDSKSRLLTGRMTSRDISSALSTSRTIDILQCSSGHQPITAINNHYFWHFITNPETKAIRTSSTMCTNELRAWFKLTSHFQLGTASWQDCTLSATYWSNITNFLIHPHSAVPLTVTTSEFQFSSQKTRMMAAEEIWWYAKPLLIHCIV